MMTKLSNKLRHWAGAGQEGLSFFCPACNVAHSIRISGDYAWGWNSDVHEPTFTPSVLVSWDANQAAGPGFEEWHMERRCHSFVTDGLIQFLGDSTHVLANKTVPLADFPDYYQ